MTSNGPDVQVYLVAAAGQGADLEERGKYYKEAAALLQQDVPSPVLLEVTEVDYASDQFGGLWHSAAPWDGWDRVWWKKGREKP